VQQIVRYLMRNGEALPYTRMRGVVSDGAALSFHDEHAGNVLHKSGGLHCQIQTLSDEIDSYRHSLGIRVTKRLLSSLFEILCFHATSYPNAMFQPSLSAC
jgi:hypothetical protein